MVAKVAVFHLRDRTRSIRVAQAMYQGVLRVGDTARLYIDDQYTSSCQESIAVFYGFESNLPRVMSEFRASGRQVVFVDLGYWSRRTNYDRFGGYHKVSVNSRHPTNYFMDRKHDDSRLKELGVKIKSWRFGDAQNVLIAGMSAKAAKAIGLQPEEWERSAIAELRKYTSRPLVYRPKPGDRNASPIEGVGYCAPGIEPHDAFRDAALVVAHHSNLAVDALVDGIPALCLQGVASPLSRHDFAAVEDLYRPEGREQWAADISWCQFTLAEMRSGYVWRHLKNEGLIT